MTKWQPIKTAPKDGSSVLLYGIQEPHELIKCDKPIVFSGYWDLTDDAWVSSGSTWTGPFYEATHWMPLPEPPEIP